MTSAPLPPDEMDRLAALRRYGILDTVPERAFDELTELAGHICAAPIALISLIDERRQWFKSRIGLTATETTREIAFCSHAILTPEELLVVPDALDDPRFADNPLVQGDPHIRFYAGAPLVTPGGQALGTLCVIDHRARTLEPEHRQAMTVLSRLVMTTLELRVSRDREFRRLEQFASLGMLVSGVAHDVRNTLCSIFGAAELIAKSSSDRRIHQCRDIILQAGTQASHLCEDLLRFARPHSDANQRYDAHAVVRTAVDLFTAAKHGVVTDLQQLPTAPCHVIGNSALLQNAFLNLFLNASDAMRNAGVIVIRSTVIELDGAVCAAHPSYPLTPGPHLQMSVSDTGCGMTPDVLSRCLEPLFTTKGEQGSGLGLPSVQRAVLEHRGALAITSTPGVGTVFTMTLPLAGSAGDQPSLPAQDGAGTGRPRG